MEFDKLKIKKVLEEFDFELRKVSSPIKEKKDNANSNSEIKNVKEVKS